MIPDQARFRRHRGACPFYRENWINSGEVGDVCERGSVLYEIYCLQNTPPVTAEEQRRCMRSARQCWRAAAHRATNAGRERADRVPQSGTAT